MTIRINGQPTKFNDSCSLHDVLSACEEYQRGFIVILNGKYVKNNEDHKSITVHESDKVDIIKFLAGG